MPMSFLAAADREPAGTLASSLTAQLREAILEGRMAPGSKLNLDELRSSFGVSLSPLREALSRLGAEGFVTMEEQRGYRVAPVSESNCREVIRLRCELEVLALTESIRNGDNAWEARVVGAYHLLGKFDNSRERLQNVEEWERLHRTFHHTLASACGMPLLLQFCAQLHDMFDRYRRLFLAQKPVDQDVPGEHRAMMQAALDRDADQAAAILRQHVERVGNNVLPYVRLAGR
ncbi:MAG TPA: FCD domain-containing protein [Ramlibacter sp.]|jgi:DNA-binding GntR family transcriptional regulator|nr:FCD domain-containing protein [Ramlibacter sp.]